MGCLGYVKCFFWLTKCFSFDRFCVKITQLYYPHDASWRGYYLSSCLSVRLSQMGVLLKRPIVGSRTQRRTTTQELQFSLLKLSTKLKMGHFSGRAKYNWGRLKLVNFDLRVVRSQVYHTKFSPYSFAACSPWCSAPRGFVSDSWALSDAGSSDSCCVTGDVSL